MSKPFKIIDIGHSGFTIDEAIAELETTISDYIFYGNTRALKIIHGHGSGTLKKAVREWCISQEGRFQAVIYGEDYDCLLYTSPSPRDRSVSRMPSSA